MLTILVIAILAALTIAAIHRLRPDRRAEQARAYRLALRARSIDRAR